MASDSTDAWKERAWALSHGGDVAGAETAWRRALEFGGDDLQAHGELGRLLYQSDRRREAIPHLRAVTSAGRGGFKALRRLAHALQEAGELDEAEAAWRGAIGAEPERLDAHAALGALLVTRGRAADAIAHLRAVVRGAPDDVKAWSRLARALEDIDDASAAAEALETVVALNPGDGMARHRLAALLEEGGRFKDATRHLRVLADANPGSVKAWRRLARALEGAGDREAALEVWRRLHTLDPTLKSVRERITLLLEWIGRETPAPPSRGAGPRVLPFDLGERVPLRGKDQILTRVERPSELAGAAQGLFMIDPGGAPMECDPVIPLRPDGSDRIQVRAVTAEAFMVGLDNATVIGRGSVITRDGEMVRELHKPNSSAYWALLDGDAFAFDQARLSEALGHVTQFDEPAFLIAGPADLAFGDWIENYFNRLALAQAAELDCRVVVRSDMPRQGLDILAAMGVPADRILHHNPNGISRFPRLYASSWPILTRARPMRARYDAYQRAALPPGPGPGALLYLSRQGVSRRSLRNEDQIAELFASRGFHIIHPERLSFAETRALFAGPACIAGPYGSAMRNAVFASRKPLCLAIRAPVSDGFKHWTAQWMAEAGMRVAFVDGAPLPGWSVELTRGDWVAPLDEVERAIDCVLGILGGSTSGS